jgi:hypothetical protein
MFGKPNNLKVLRNNSVNVNKTKYY